MDTCMTAKKAPSMTQLPTKQVCLSRLDGGLETITGLRFGAVSCGLKKPGELDLGVIVSEQPRHIAGVFTKNLAAAAPVQFCRQQLEASSDARTIIINSGYANALTGDRGLEDVQAIVESAKALFGGPVYPLSTGIIGVPLPREAVLRGLERCHKALGGDALSVAQAMLTTDTTTKTACRLLQCEAGSFHVAGVAKGSGMIHPNMATVLSVMATDAPLSANTLATILQRVTTRTFNRISVDGDTSTNDSVLALCAQDPKRELSLADALTLDFERAFEDIAAELCEQIVADGDGATKVIKIRVYGAHWRSEAEAVARAIANSPLVKTALHGGDFNWGRIISAACNAQVSFDVNDLELAVDKHLIFRSGQAVDDLSAAAQAFQQDQVLLQLKIGSGSEQVTLLTTDLSPEYISTNSQTVQDAEACH